MSDLLLPSWHVRHVRSCRAISSRPTSRTRTSACRLPPICGQPIGARSTCGLPTISGTIAQSSLRPCCSARVSGSAFCRCASISVWMSTFAVQHTAAPGPACHCLGQTCCLLPVCAAATAFAGHPTAMLAAAQQALCAVNLELYSQQHPDAQVLKGVPAPYTGINALSKPALSAV